MALKSLFHLKKRSKANGHESTEDAAPTSIHEFTFLRSDTYTQDVISLPSFHTDETPKQGKEVSSSRKSHSRYRSTSNASTASREPRGEKRLSSLLNLRNHSHDSRVSSVNVPPDLPSVNDSKERREENEALWEERATILARENPNLRKLAIQDSQSATPAARPEAISRPSQHYEDLAHSRLDRNTQGDVGNDTHGLASSINPVTG